MTYCDVVPFLYTEVLVVEVELEAAPAKGSGLPRGGVDVRCVLLWQASHWVPWHAQGLVVIGNIIRGIPILDLHEVFIAVVRNTNHLTYVIQALVTDFQIACMRRNYCMKTGRQSSLDIGAQEEDLQSANALSSTIQAAVQWVKAKAKVFAHRQKHRQDCIPCGGLQFSSEGAGWQSLGERRTHCDVPGLAIGSNVCDGGLVPGVLREVVVNGCIVH